MGMAREKKLKAAKKGQTEELASLRLELQHERAIHSETFKKLMELSAMSKDVVEKNVWLFNENKKHLAAQGEPVSKDDTIRVLADILKIPRTPVAAYAFFEENNYCLVRKMPVDPGGEEG